MRPCLAAAALVVCCLGLLVTPACARVCGPLVGGHRCVGAGDRRTAGSANKPCARSGYCRDDECCTKVAG
jgi:hypothetical protein